MRERGERQKLILTRHRKRHRDCQTDGKREIYIYIVKEDELQRKQRNSYTQLERKSNICT